MTFVSLVYSSDSSNYDEVGSDMTAAVMVGPGWRCFRFHNLDIC